jgi:hypothetical protein
MRKIMTTFLWTDMDIVQGGMPDCMDPGLEAATTGWLGGSGLEALGHCFEDTLVVVAAHETSLVLGILIDQDGCLVQGFHYLLDR